MKYQTKKKALLLLADGTIFYGKAVGDKDGTAFGEVCFNTGMTGYQEIFTDPSYFGQLMVTTNAHIGNYGTNIEEVESDSIKIGGLICKNFSYEYSRVAADSSLKNFMDKNDLFAISDVDTRALVSYIRDHGAMNAVMSTDMENIEGLKKELAKVPSMDGLELSSKVSTKEPYLYGDEKATYKIAALDIGIKKNILRNLEKRDAFIKVFPYNTSFEEMSAWNPDAYFISNGPGDPEPLIDAIAAAKKMIASNKPLFGICLVNNPSCNELIHREGRDYIPKSWVCCE
jgi:carbamoyl-phosphate synthase small subunit